MSILHEHAGTVSIAPRVGLSGRFRIEKRKAGTDIVTHPGFGFQKNLITNIGLDALTEAPNGALVGLVVGSGNSTPSFTDQQLDNLIAKTTTAASPAWTIDEGTRHLVFTRTWTFTAPSATGNISELGITYTGSPPPAAQLLFTRSLILDEFGSPTTITVLSDEDLVVTYEIRIKQPTEDFPFTLASGHTGIARSAYINTLRTSISSQSHSANGWGVWSSGSVSNAGQWPRWFPTMDTSSSRRFSPNGVGAITGGPGSLTNGTSANPVIASYVPGSYFRSGTWTMPTGSLNDTAWRSVVWSAGPCCFQAEWSPTITKNNTQTLRVGFGLSWGRE